MNRARCRAFKSKSAEQCRWPCRRRFAAEPRSADAHQPREFSECSQSNFPRQRRRGADAAAGAGLLEGVRDLRSSGGAVGRRAGRYAVLREPTAHADEMFIPSTTREVPPVNVVDGEPVGAGAPAGDPCWRWVSRARGRLSGAALVRRRLEATGADRLRSPSASLGLTAASTCAPHEGAETRPCSRVGMFQSALKTLARVGRSSAQSERSAGRRMTGLDLTGSRLASAEAVSSSPRLASVGSTIASGHRNDTVGA